MLDDPILITLRVNAVSMLFDAEKMVFIHTPYLTNSKCCLITHVVDVFFRCPLEDFLFSAPGYPQPL